MNEKLLTFVPKIHFPKSIYFGKRSLTFFQAIQGKALLFVVSKSWKEKNGEQLPSLAKESPVFEHSGEPTNADVSDLKEFCKNKKTKYIVAIGGGSVIDLVKVVKHDLTIAMIAIPTTIGSGSEVSQFALISDASSHKKHVVTSVSLLPEVVIIEQSFFATLSREQIIHQGLDGFAHAIESLVSRMSNHFSDMLSLAATESIYHLLLAFSESEKQESVFYEKLKIATTLAGIAQSSAATGLVHAFAHVIGAKARKQHAIMVSEFLLDVLSLNLQKTDTYGKLNSLKTLSQRNIIDKLERLYKKLALSPRKVTVPGESRKLAEEIRHDVCTMSNPYAPTTDDIHAILEKHR